MMFVIKSNQIQHEIQIKENEHLMIPKQTQEIISDMVDICETENKTQLQSNTKSNDIIL